MTLRVNNRRADHRTAQQHPTGSGLFWAAIVNLSRRCMSSLSGALLVRDQARATFP